MPSWTLTHRSLISVGSGRPFGPVLQSHSRFARLRDDLRVVERGEPAGATQDATIDDHSIHVRRHSQRDDRLVGVAGGRHVYVRGADQYEIVAFAGRD